MAPILKFEFWREFTRIFEIFFYFILFQQSDKRTRASEDDDTRPHRHFTENADGEPFFPEINGTFELLEIFEEIEPSISKLI